MSRPLVTVKTLLAQVRQQGEIELPADALITPAAADWLQGSRVPVRRADAACTPPDASGVVTYLAGDARNPTVRILLPGLERQYGGVKFVPCNGNLGGLLDAVREMCAGLAECSKRRGIVVVEEAGPIVSCVANKCAHVRAAILTKPSALFGLIRNLGVNLLILESTRLSLQQLRGTIDGFLTARTSIAPAIEAALAEWSASVTRG